MTEQAVSTASNRFDVSGKNFCKEVDLFCRTFPVPEVWMNFIKCIFPQLLSLLELMELPIAVCGGFLLFLVPVKLESAL